MKNKLIRWGRRSAVNAIVVVSAMLLMASYMQPASARYIEADPIGLEGGSWSTYAYVDGNPVSSVDPTGTTEYKGKADAPLQGPVDWAVSAGKNWVLDKIDVQGANANGVELSAYGGAYVLASIGLPASAYELFYVGKLEKLSFASGDIVYGIFNKDTSLMQLIAGGKLLPEALLARGRHIRDFCNADDASRWLLESVIKDGGTIHFNLNGVDNLLGILSGTHYQDKYTSKELQFIHENWDALKDKVNFYHMGMPFDFEDIRSKVPRH